ncbi:uncharacterized protein si:ch211-243a20.4 [Pygocentrus nattereri]|uniref:uncharacterized protein si:ch211-243a20.4 n=1 Tax=Pygocentrus nattereri TaxID=42514 RepID=UPI0008147FEC|nr:uncharacterized protein si:ch211-243a20.4 [Pygocentrus nattereri]
MFAVHLGIYCIFLLCCSNKSQANDLVVNNRTSVALANETLHFHIRVTVPANSSGTKVFCSRNGHEVWKEYLHSAQSGIKVELWANITINNSSSSGEYIFQYLEKKVYCVALVRDVGYIEPNESLEADVIALLVVTTILLIFSIVGSIYIFKWQKDHPKSEKGGDGVKVKNRQSNVGVTAQGLNSESVYTALEPRPVSIYDVLNVDQVRRESTKRTSEETAKTSQVEEGIFESVYENL